MVSQRARWKIDQVCVYACMHMLDSVQLYDPMDCSPPDSSVHEIFQARMLEGLPFPPLGALPDPWIKPESLASSALAGRLYHLSHQQSLCVYRLFQFPLLWLHLKLGHSIFFR